jgi:hypothetical protein
MSFNKIIISSIAQVVKDSISFEDVIDKIIDEVQKKFLPFPISDIPRNPPQFPGIGNLPPPGLDSLPPFPGIPKEKLSSIIQTKNQLTEALQSLQTVIQTVEKVSSTADGVVTGLDTTIKTVKAIPAPTAVLGVGIPINVLTILSDVLDVLGKIVSVGKGALSIIPYALGTMKKSISKVLEKLLFLDQILNILISNEINKEVGPDATPQEKEEAQTKLFDELGFISTPSNLILGEDNSNNPNDDLSQLQQNSTNPRFYKGYQLILEHESSNTISAPKRRIKGVKLEGNKKSPTSIVLYNQPDGSYSFSSSVEILINEIKFRIDTDDDGKLEEAVETLLYEPFGEPGDNNEVRQTKDGKSWYFNQNSLQWILMYQPFGEPSTHGEIRSYDYNKENKPDLGLRFFVFGENGVEGIKVTLPSSTSGPGGAWFLIYAPFYVPGANNEKRYSEKEKKMYTFSESRKQWVREN